MPISISPSSPLPFATNGVSYNLNLSASGGNSPYTFELVDGAFPNGITITSGGNISGTPNDTPGTFNFDIEVNGSPPYNPSNTVTTASFVLTLYDPIEISPATIDDAARGYSYSETFSASGGSPPYTFSIVSGSLPSGITLTSGGLLSGTPTGSAGNYTFDVRATDSTSRRGTSTYVLVVQNRIDIDPDTLPNGNVGSAYSQTLTATGGTSPRTFAVTSGSLPPGLSLSSGGSLTGTPTTTGIYVFRVRVRDNRNRDYFWNYVIRIDAAIAPPSGPPTYFISVNTTTINEGGSAIYSISLTNFGDGFLYWKNVGTTTANDFRDGLNEGSLLISNNTGTLIRSLSNDFKTEIVETIDIQLRTGSTIGPIVATTSTVSVEDTSNTPREIVSGVLILDDDYNIIQSRVEEILGLGLDGYGIAAVRSTQVLKSNRITRNQWNNLLRDMDRISTHVYGTSSGYSTITNSVTAVTTSRSVDYFNFTNNIYFNDGIRYSCYPGGTYPTQFIEQEGIDVAYLNGNSTSTNTVWYGSMSHIYRMRWATPLLARHFFNAGGILTWLPFYEPGPAESQSDADWASLLAVYRSGGFGGYFEYKREDWITTGTTLTRTYSSGTKSVVITAEKNVETNPSIDQYPDRIKLTAVFVDTSLPAFIVTPSGYNLEPGP